MLFLLSSCACFKIARCENASIISVLTGYVVSAQFPVKILFTKGLKSFLANTLFAISQLTNNNIVDNVQNMETIIKKTKGKTMNIKLFLMVSFLSISSILKASSYDNTTTSAALMKVVARFENFSPTAYYGSGENFQTIGFGHKIMSNEQHLSKQTLSETQGYSLMAQDLKTRANIGKYINVQLNDYQYDALRSLCFNIGEGNFGTSTLVKTVNSEGGDSTASYEFFGHWRKAAGSISNGIIKRRFGELMIYADRPLDPDDSALPSDQWNIDAMPITDENWGRLRSDLRSEAVDIFNLYTSSYD